MSTIELNVVGARRYSFNDRETGRLVEGVNVFYLNKEVNDDVVGLIPSKVVLPLHYFDKVKTFNFPSVCTATLTQTLTAKGVKTSVTDINPVRSNVK